MKIQSSNIIMSSSHSYNSFSYAESTTIEGRASDDLEGVVLSLSEQTNGNYKEAMEMVEKQKENVAKQNQEQLRKSLSEQLKSNNTKQCGKIEMSDEYKMKLELIKRLMDLLKDGEQYEKLPMKSINEGRRISLSHQVESSFSSVSVGAVSTGNSGGAGTLWTRVTAKTGFYSEQESTTFSSVGQVRTSDGINIDFSVDVSMTRAYMEEINILESTNYILTDPLVINLDTNITSLSEQKFMFDINSDGQKEEISFVGDGSGFLALDKNNDGVINDGSELFGTASGDGFKDLSAFDTDKNGWIDENDSIFNKLKVWTKNEEGKDMLISLKDADVGAIYLDNAYTEFSFKDDNNKTDGVLRKTGIYLKESSGRVGTMAHVDLAL